MYNLFCSDEAKAAREKMMAGRKTNAA